MGLENGWLQGNTACCVSVAGLVCGAVVRCVLHHSHVPRCQHSAVLGALCVCQSGVRDPHRRHQPHLSLQQQRGGLTWRITSLALSCKNKPVFPFNADLTVFQINMNTDVRLVGVNEHMLRHKLLFGVADWVQKCRVKLQVINYSCA